MTFEEGFIYHVFNQGNNKQKIFFCDDNYMFFLKKIRTHIAPYSDILAWCLMPNHFHLMLLVNHQTLLKDSKLPITRSETLSRTPGSIISLNKSIGIMLASYTRAINKKYNLTGSLFRTHTKAECINCPDQLTPSFITKCGASILTYVNPEDQYPQICFNYIHQNPVKTGLVKSNTDWLYSSARDYAGMRNGKLVNNTIAKKLGIVF